MSFENGNLRLESILDRIFSSDQRNVRIVGSNSSTLLSALLTNSLSSSFKSLPNLIVFKNSSQVNFFAQSLSFFDSQCYYESLPHFDVTPYVGLYPKPQIVSQRLRFLNKAQHAKPGEIFLASIGSLVQKTLPFEELARNCAKWAIDHEIPDDFVNYLNRIGYIAVPVVEDIGQFSIRGGIVDIFSPAHSFPIRIELFGQTIQSMRFFSANDQKSFDKVSFIEVIPAREIIWNESQIEKSIEAFKKSIAGREIEPSEIEEAIRSLSRKTSFPGIDFLLPYFYKNLSLPTDHFSSELNVWLVDPVDIMVEADSIANELREDFSASLKQLIRPEVSSLYCSANELQWPEGSRTIELTNIDQETFSNLTENETKKKSTDIERVSYLTHPLTEFTNLLRGFTVGSDPWLNSLNNKLREWQSSNHRIIISTRGKIQAERIRLFLDKIEIPCVLFSQDEFNWPSWLSENSPSSTIYLVQRPLSESVRIPEEGLVFLREEDLLGKKSSGRNTIASQDFQKQARRLSFADLKPGDCIVHVQHGIGVYEGLKIMMIGGAESEFIQLSYKDNDKLYLPVYRVNQLQKYSGAAQTTVLDKLGGAGWEKTKIKVRGHLKDIAADLLQLYAKRSEMTRPPMQITESDLSSFEASFPYEETVDQLRAIADIEKDFLSNKPMDRLICGDVGFGKTEVCMRATFIAVQNKMQVAILAPTTVLTFQHFETFKKRFRGIPVEIRELNRFVTNAEAKKTLKELSEGKVDIIIGTHRLLSKDVQFKNLGLLVIDEEQKFGVTHKEKIRKLRTNVDTLAMSATPIPRTLNMSLVGVRDLSLINTAPVDRLPTRTFITKWEDETIRKAIKTEISRGGQVYFLHNRVQSIYGIADEIRKIVPEARIKVGHGQMPEEELEKNMVQFFNHEIDVLVCTAIVESGMDVSRANTMFIDQAHTLGLSQLYQLRGRVGRSKQRAYCYLLLPKSKNLEKTAQERLKVIQENSDLGSGIKIAQYDLELRGAGDLLGEEQSGHINAVGYELYMDLLNEAIQQLRGVALDDQNVEPEINLKISALIPHQYISDIRLRLSYYKALSEIRSQEELEQIEEELKDQFGKIPEQTLNLIGLMLIRLLCKDLKIRDLSAGFKNISLSFSEKTSLKPETVVGLAMQNNKKYTIAPDNRLNIRMNTISWPQVYEELTYLLKLKSK